MPRIPKPTCCSAAASLRRALRSLPTMRKGLTPRQAEVSLRERTFWPASCEEMPARPDRSPCRLCKRVLFEFSLQSSSKKHFFTNNCFKFVDRSCNFLVLFSQLLFVPRCQEYNVLTGLTTFKLLKLQTKILSCARVCSERVDQS